MENQRIVRVLFAGLMLSVCSAVPANTKTLPANIEELPADMEEAKDTSSSPEDSSRFPFTPPTGSPPPDLPSLNTTHSAPPPDVSLTSIMSRRGGPRANIHWLAHLIPGSNAGISILDLRVIINMVSFVLSMFSMARFAFQVVNALLGIFSTSKRKLHKRQLPGDFFAQLFEPSESPLPYNVTGNSGEAILEHFRLLHIEPEVCRMKAICEVMKEPKVNRTFEELVASTFGGGQSDEESAAVIRKNTFKGYHRAAQLGRKRYDCSRAFRGCSKSYRDFLLAANG